MSNQSIKVFIAYSRKDEPLKSELADHLSILRDQSVITIWHDGLILPGEPWDEKIKAELDSSDLFLPLISVDFLTSSYAQDNEVARAVERHNNHEILIVPIILRDVDWHNTLYKAFQALPANAKPVTAWTDRDAAWTSITQGIRKLANNYKKTGRFQDPILNSEDQSGQDSFIFSQSNMNSYRERIDSLASKDGGKLTNDSETFLEAIRVSQNISSQAASKVKESILKPYGEYTRLFAHFAENQYPLNMKRQAYLRELQEELGLSNSASLAIEERVCKELGLDFSGLVSKRGADYSLLKEFLSNEYWSAADFETYRLMLQLQKKDEDWGEGFHNQRDSWMSRSNIRKLKWLSCEDLKIINSLWTDYSQKRFGFSVQKKIYLESGGKLKKLDEDDDYEIIFKRKAWKKFLKEVGWKSPNKDGWTRFPYSYSNLSFNITAPSGHLPSCTGGMLLLWFPDSGEEVSEFNFTSEYKDDIAKYRLGDPGEQWGYCIAGEVFSRLEKCGL